MMTSKEAFQKLMDDITELGNSLGDELEILYILKPYLKKVMEFEEEGKLQKITFKPFTFITVLTDGFNYNSKIYKTIKEFIEDEE